MVIVMMRKGDRRALCQVCRCCLWYDLDQGCKSPNTYKLHPRSFTSTATIAMPSPFVLPPSPDGETFLTPPTTPMPPEILMKPSLSRKNSRPSNLHLSNTSTEWTPDVILDPQVSPEFGLESSSAARPSNTPSITNGGAPRAAEPRSQVTPPYLPPRMEQPTRSPCFIHSHLNNSASLTDWLKAKRAQEAAARKKRPHQLSTDGMVYGEDEAEEAFSGSLTAQLAETAVGVREMSKQLGASASLRPLSPNSFAHLFPLITANRTRKSSFHHSTCPHCHKSPR